ncbi:MAG: hypothetical protein WAV28_06305 [Sedimentisphaerales bacterium]|jgi:hypothetical protein
MIEKVDANQIHGFLEKSSSSQPNSAAAHPDNDVDASIQVDYASFIERAMQAPKTDTQAVQKARELLVSGQLESPKNIKRAAENIINFGI